MLWKESVSAAQRPEFTDMSEPSRNTNTVVAARDIVANLRGEKDALSLKQRLMPIVWCRGANANGGVAKAVRKCSIYRW